MKLSTQHLFVLPIFIVLMSGQDDDILRSEAFQARLRNQVNPVLESRGYQMASEEVKTGPTPTSEHLDIRVFQRYKRNHSAERPAAEMRVTLSVYTSREDPDAIDPMKWGQPTKGRLPNGEIVDVFGISNARLAVPGSFSGVGIGERRWNSAPKLNSLPVSLWVSDGRFWVSVYYGQQQTKPLERDSDWRPQEFDLIEEAARITLAQAYMAEIGFHRLPSTTVQFDAGALTAKRTDAGFLLVPVGEALRAVGGRLTDRSFGVFTMEYRGRSITTGIASREIIVGEETVRLPIPVLHDGEELWVERATFARALLGP